MFIYIRGLLANTFRSIRKLELCAKTYDLVAADKYLYSINTAQSQNLYSYM